MAMPTAPTDEEILAEITALGAGMTYVIRNRLCAKYRDLKTAAVLRRLKKLEAEGKVERVPSAYLTQLCWQTR